MSFHFTFSEIYPVKEYFFYIAVRDRSMGYERFNQIVIDIPTAFAFFGEDPSETNDLVGQLVRTVVTSWNNTHKSLVRSSSVEKKHLFIECSTR